MSFAISPAVVFGAIGVVALIGLLMAKELLSASEDEKARRLGRRGKGAEKKYVGIVHKKK